MNAVNNLVKPQASARFETALNELVLTLNDRRQGILDRYQVGELEVEIIRFLTEHEQKKMKEVGEHFRIKLSTLTSTIDKLEKAKLVKRKNSREDRRVIFIRPTAKGEALLNELGATTRDVSQAIIKDSKSNEFDCIVQGFDRMLSYLKQA